MFKRFYLAVSIFLCMAFSFANANDVSTVMVTDVSECSITQTALSESVENAFVFSASELQANSEIRTELFTFRESSRFTAFPVAEIKSNLTTEVGWQNLA